MKLAVVLVSGVLLSYPAPAAAQWEDSMPMSAPAQRSPTEERAGIGLMVAAPLVTTIGAGIIASGASQSCSGTGIQLCGLGDAVVGAFVSVTGGALLVTGIPLMMAGASNRDAQSYPMVLGGTAITTSGIGALGVGLTLFLLESPRESSTPRGLAAAGALVAGGALLTGGGIVMYVIGNRHAKTEPAPTEPGWLVPPEVRLAPGFTSLHWVF